MKNGDYTKSSLKALDIFPVPTEIRNDPDARNKLLDLIADHGIDVSAFKNNAKNNQGTKRLIDFNSIGADKVIENEDKEFMDITDLAVDSVKKQPKSEAVKEEAKRTHQFVEQKFVHSK